MKNRGEVGQDLLRDLLTFQVETLVMTDDSPADCARVPPVDLTSLIGEVTGGRIAWLEEMAPRSGNAALPLVGESSELDAETLLALSDQARRLADPARPAQGAASSGSPERWAIQSDPDVAVRTADALRLVASLVAPADDPRGVEVPVRAATALPSADRLLRLRAGFGSQDVDDARIAALDRRAMRELARYWELGSQSVWYRTTMELDGDVLTGIRFRAAATGPLERAHARVAAAAMAHWQFLILGFGVLIQMVAGPLLRPRRFRAPKRRSLASSLRVASAEAGLSKVKTPGPFELIRRAWRLFAIGRIVFESPVAGEGSEVRTVIHPGGDIETSVRSVGLSESVLVDHVNGVTLWLAELAVGFQRIGKRVSIVAFVGGPILAGVAWRSLGPSPIRLIVTLAVGLLPALARWGIRRYARRRILALRGRGGDDLAVVTQER